MIVEYFLDVSKIFLGTFLAFAAIVWIASYFSPKTEKSDVSGIYE